MSVNDRLYDEFLFDELLRPTVDDYYAAAKALAEVAEATTGPRLALTARMNALRECGDRMARVLEAEPLWEDMRVMAGLTCAMAGLTW